MSLQIQNGNKAFEVIVTGTDPTVVRGGIGFVLPGYFAALEATGLRWHFVATYHATAWGGRILWAIGGLVRILWMMARSRRGETTVVYSHPGAKVSLIRESIVLRCVRLFGAKTVIQIHTPQVQDYLKTPGGRRVLEFAFGSAHVVTVLTPWWKRLLEQSFPAIDFLIVPNPMPPECSDAAIKVGKSVGGPRAPTADNRKTVLAMARLVPGKGISTVIEAMAQLPENIRLNIAGAGPHETALREKSEMLELADRITFLGWVGGEEKEELLQSANVFCLPSVNDSFGMVYIEAMCRGIPVVAGDWGPIRDVIPEGAGRLVPINDATATAAGIRDVLEYAMDRKDISDKVLARFAPAVIAPALQAAMEKAAIS